MGTVCSTKLKKQKSLGIKSIVPQDALVKRKEGSNITNYGKMVKKKLIDLDRTQNWLTEEVNKITGLRSDSKYIGKVLRGVRNSRNIKSAINEVLGLRE